MRLRNVMSRIFKGVNRFTGPAWRFRGPEINLAA